MAMDVEVVVILKHHHITYNIELTFNQLTVHFYNMSKKKKKRVKHFFLSTSVPSSTSSFCAFFILPFCLSACFFFNSSSHSCSFLSVCVHYPFARWDSSFNQISILLQKNPARKNWILPHIHILTQQQYTHISINFIHKYIYIKPLSCTVSLKIYFFLSLLLSYSDGILFQISFVVPSNVLLSFFLVVMWAHECASVRSDVMLRFTFSSTFFYYHYNYTKSKTTCLHVYFTFCHQKGNFLLKNEGLAGSKGLTEVFKLLCMSDASQHIKLWYRDLQVWKKASQKWVKTARYPRSKKKMYMDAVVVDVPIIPTRPSSSSNFIFTFLILPVKENPRIH